MKKAAYIAWAILILMVMCGCKTVKTVETVRDVYKTRTDTVRDSIYRDVFKTVYIKNDTVHELQTEYVYKDRWRVHTDTVMMHDTLTSVSTTTVTTPRTMIEKLQTGTWWWILMIATAEGLIIYYRRKQ